MKTDVPDIAEAYVLNTNEHVFLTGKAGTGKTTLLKKILAKTTKNTVVVAPTGVAAINAGGTTFHAMFHLPTTSFIPNNHAVDFNIALNRNELAKHCRFNKEHRKVLEEMELLIIDEVSMVRSDLLDAVDFVLQYIRRKRVPFGGVQVLMIGDLMQLAPIMRDDSWKVLSTYYNSPYFFDAQVIQHIELNHFELTKIYRQSDSNFIYLLNNIRNGIIEEDDYYTLEKRYFPNFEITEKGFITLCTHNKTADSINEEQLIRLNEKMLIFDAKLTGDFPPSMFPTLGNLKLKVGAQIMFIRNDKGEKREFYNGKIGIFEEIVDDDSIKVFLLYDKKSIIVEREEWENYRYEVNEDTNQIEKKVIGTFQQYPIKLAWAITIHKSQGLTFEKAVIDAGSAFAAGQVYVALSRCTSLDGIILKSKITQQSLQLDLKVNEYLDNTHFNNIDLEKLAIAQKAFSFYQIKKIFDFQKLLNYYGGVIESTKHSSIPELDTALSFHQKQYIALNNIQQIAEKFIKVINDFFTKNEIENFIKKTESAIHYFTENIFIIQQNIHEHKNEWSIKQKSKVYSGELQNLINSIGLVIKKMYQLTYENEYIYKDEIKFGTQFLKNIELVSSSNLQKKGNTFLITLDLYNSGKTVDEIAALRSLSVNTIYSHIEKFIATGEISLNNLVDDEKVALIEKAITANPNATNAELKSLLTDDIEWHELRLVRAAITHKQNASSTTDTSI